MLLDVWRRRIGIGGAIDEHVTDIIAIIIIIAIAMIIAIYLDAARFVQTIIIVIMTGTGSGRSVGDLLCIWVQCSCLHRVRVISATAAFRATTVTSDGTSCSWHNIIIGAGTNIG